MDLLPTVLDYCGIPLPGQAEAEAQTPCQRGAARPLTRFPGRSWRPLLEAGEEQLHGQLVIENDDPTTGLQVRCLVTDRYRLSIYPGTSDGELFELQEDPDELYNLWYRPEHRSTRDLLAARLLDAYAAATPWHPIPPWNA